MTTFMQNKANLPGAEINAKSVMTKVYGNFYGWRQRKNKPKTNPISSERKRQPSKYTLQGTIMQNKANFLKARMSVNPIYTKDYGNESRLATQGKQSQ